MRTDTVLSLVIRLIHERYLLVPVIVFQKVVAVMSGVLHATEYMA